MPSFTLLGTKVLRLPFIINSSYPHEILHNWWGNGVFVDYEKGNWCEGLTAYLADYLIAENRGKGTDYRMTTLQKYSDYVRGGKDFPLTEFRSRHSSASEAVGYGKALMFYHMLRRLLGDEGFRKGLRGFYAANKFNTAGFAQLRQAFEKVTGPGRLKPFFEQWTARAGAPALAIKSVNLTKGQFGYDLEFTLAQTQDGPAYELEVPSVIYLEGVEAPRMKTLTMKSKEETYHYNSALLRPVRLEIDPEFDLFRRLSPLETPPTLSRLLGAVKPDVIVPAGAAGAPWRALAAAWNKDKENLPAVSGDDESSAPPASSYWIFGGGNLLAPAFEAALGAYGAVFTPDSVTLENRRFPRAGHTFVFAAFNQADPAFSGALVVSGTPEKLPLLAAKLPHYGKYSWLVFDENMAAAASGVWTAAGSPLAVPLPGPGGAPARNYPARAPLAELPSLFSASRVLADVRALSSVKGGRAPGTPGHLAAKKSVNAALVKAGLKPYARSGQGNVVGVVEGTSKKDEYVVLSAHYDHLPAKDGQVFPGADDNASGVALLLELARYYGARRPERSIIFAAFDGEEGGRLGSRAFLKALPPDGKAKVNAALNFDTVGRLGSGKILVLGSGSSDKWVHIFRGAGFVTGFSVRGYTMKFYRPLLALAAAALVAGFNASAADNELTDQEKSDGYVLLFNGKDLTGWEGESDFWSVQDGMIIGKTTAEKKVPFNKFVIWRGGTVKNFELRVVLKQAGNNSGIQYRSREMKQVGPFSVGGYQCDIHPSPAYNGMLYEERGRGIVCQNGQKVIVDDKGGKWIVSSTAPVECKNDEWHEFTLIAQGNHLIHKIDGKTAMELYDHDTAKRALEGILAIQLHGGPPMTVQVKNIRLKTLPEGGMVSLADMPVPPDAKKVEPPKPRAKKGAGKKVSAK